jgi:UDPglucose--hexose-1-phosphate uridylyltransferase
VGEKIRFSKHFQKCLFHNPMLGGKLDSQELEIRREPLSGRQSIFNPGLRDKVAILFPPSVPALIERLARESESGCFLCGDRWKKMTPTYPEALVTGGRVEVGESVLFPNLFPLSQVHAVIRVGSKHYMPLHEFPTQPIEEAFGAFREFARHLSHADPAVRFLTLNGNYLAPAGASIIHPHFQVLGSDVPFSHLEELLTLSSRYRKEHGTCYWKDLVEKEQEIGLRSIAGTGAVHWIAGFSPQGSNEVLGILTERRDFLEMEDKDFSDLAEGLSAVLRGYGAMGFSTFNFTLYSGPLGAGEDAFRCFLRVISRQNVYENYRTDDYFLQKLLKNEIILTTPESLASTLRDFFET